jgi:hypothetical protein
MSKTIIYIHYLRLIIIFYIYLKDYKFKIQNDLFENNIEIYSDKIRLY